VFQPQSEDPHGPVREEDNAVPWVILRALLEHAELHPFVIGAVHDEAMDKPDARDFLRDYLVAMDCTDFARTQSCRGCEAECSAEHDTGSRHVPRIVNAPNPLESLRIVREKEVKLLDGERVLSSRLPLETF
jgi:hypothetical protein